MTVIVENSSEPESTWREVSQRLAELLLCQSINFYVISLKIRAVYNSIRNAEWDLLNN